MKYKVGDFVIAEWNFEHKGTHIRGFGEYEKSMFIITKIIGKGKYGGYTLKQLKPVELLLIYAEFARMCEEENKYNDFKDSYSWVADTNERKNARIVRKLKGKELKEAKRLWRKLQLLFVENEI